MSEPTVPPPLRPMPYASPYRQPSDDQQHLKLLSIFHWVVGGLTALISCMFIMHIVMGSLMVSGNFPMSPPTSAATQQTVAPPQFDAMMQTMGWFAICAGSGAVVLGWTTGALTIYSGFCIKRRRRRVFSIVIAAINCLHFPFGTVLGVFTIIVLIRDSVRAIYDTEAQTPHGRS